MSVSQTLLWLMVALVLALVACGGDDDDDDSPFHCDDNACADENYGLMWERVPLGGLLAYDKADDYCAALTLAGYDDWRVPDISELRTLVVGCPATEPDGECLASTTCYDGVECLNEACGACVEVHQPIDFCYWNTAFLGSCEDYYWSSTPIGDDGQGRWGLDFDLAEIELLVTGPVYPHYVRCVRTLAE